jgi:signal transduction histidine kinase
VRLEEVGVALVGLEQLVDDDPERAQSVLDDVADTSRQALEDLRDLARGLFPALLADRGLVPALEAYVRTARLPAEIDTSRLTNPQRLDPQAEASVYFCVTQALSNASKYAAGSAICLRLAADDGRLAFTVADDGPGAELATLARGQDLQDMRDRVEAVGGVFEVSSAVGAGTTVSGWVPAHRLIAV